MAISQLKSKRKASGGRLRSSRSKKKQELAGFPTHTKLSNEERIKVKRVLGGNSKIKILAANKISVADKKGKVTVTELVNVVENPANPHLVRRNVITKGAVVETKLGKVKITSRPGQEGTVSGKLL
ncbi:30S ribosomal protein S8e [Candidatus Woesearchaeota archaeon CG_4_10_14_0_2_um_filter_33_13]|nr:MAG: 30S ribosomal protein S8e [Candidatus Woesearchaeota archaeon CG_4_10_14_0_2_um_filter_33_13]